MDSDPKIREELPLNSNSSLTAADETDSSSINLKYGDSDLSSKKRKNCNQLKEIISKNSTVRNSVHDDDDANYHSFENIAIDSDDNLNSTFNDTSKTSYSGISNSSHYKNNSNQKTDSSCKIVISNTSLEQGNLSSLLSSSSSSSSLLSLPLAKQSKNCAKSNSFISKSPSGTSKGFENTFCILEKQISENRNKRMYLRRISEEYIPNFSSLMQDDNYCSTISSITTTTDTSLSCCNSVSEKSPIESMDLFELELEVIERLKRYKTSTTYNTNPLSATSSLPSNSSYSSFNLNKNDVVSSFDEASCCNKVITSPINELLYGINPRGLPVQTTTTTSGVSMKIDGTSNNDDDVSSSALQKTNEKILEEEICDYPEYIYHIAIGKDGKKHLRRVARDPSNDEVLCGNRVSQMTRAYDDIEAVTRLLEEKEKDLELTVQIGKELLQQNNRLEGRITELENELKSSNEDRSQLLHDLHQKNELIAILTNDVDEGVENDTPTVSKSITLDLLQRKIQSLQDENKSLKQEASQLVKQTDEVEEQERKLMENITLQLNTAHNQYDGLNLELERLKEENRLQHEQIVSLTARLSEAEIRLHQLTTENDEQCSILSITKENQSMLATELSEFKARYQEVLALLQEAQEQLRKYRKKSLPQARSSFLSGLGAPHPDSLHSELMESSLYSDNSLDSGISADRLSGITGGLIGGMIPPYRKAFETVRCATKNGNFTDSMSQLGVMTLSSSSQMKMSTMPYIPPGAGSTSQQHQTSSIYSGSTMESSSMGPKTSSCESLASQSSEIYPSSQKGIPGVPGAKDLEAALKRLTTAEVLARRAMLSHAPAGTYTYEDNYNTMPLGIRTPDSIMSTGSSGISYISSNQWRLPEKLQIVKPMEGSQTLHHWSRLATPTLGGLLEERPGVTIRGGRGLEELGMQVYSLCDVEEDVEDHPGKQFEGSNCVYTYTNSTIMHPDDGSQSLNFLSQSQLSSRIASASTSRQPSCPPTPRAGLSRRNSCSTFSVNMGLASMLSERGIKAITPSALNTPMGPNYSPTVTPCNSPEGSPTRSMSPEPLFGILSSGADLIRRKIIGNPEPLASSRHQQSNQKQKIMLSRLEKRALRSLKLLEKVESVGLENIITTQSSGVSNLASGIASRSASPMAQLTSLKNIHPSTGGGKLFDDIHSSSANATSSRILMTSSDLSDDSGTSSLNSLNSNMSDSSSEFAKKQQNAQIGSISAQNSTSASSSANNNNEMTPTDIRLKQLQRQKSRRHFKNGIGGQRPDLGTVAGRIRPDLGKVDSSIKSKQTITAPETVTSEKSTAPTTTQSMTQSFVGSISSLFFGRKGGWL